MVNPDEQLLKVFSRLKKDGDGMEFIKYLENLSRENYEAFRGSKDSSMNDVHKGYALAIDSIIKVFESADDKLLQQSKTEVPNII